MSLSVLTDVALVAADLFVGYHVYGELQTVYQWWVHRPPPTPPPPADPCKMPIFHIPASYKKVHKVACEVDNGPQYSFTIGDFTIYTIYEPLIPDEPHYCLSDWVLTGWKLGGTGDVKKYCTRLQGIALGDITIDGHVKFFAMGNLSHGTGKGYLTKNKNYLNGQ